MVDLNLLTVGGSFPVLMYMVEIDREMQVK